MEKILCIGYYGKGNLGDEAILSSFINSLEEQGIARNNIIISTSNIMYSKNKHRTHAINRKSLISMIIGIIRSKHIVFSGGGWHFNKPAVLFYSIFITSLSKILGKTVSLYCIGVEPIDSSYTNAVRLLLGLCDWISVRDEFSWKQLVKSRTSKKISIACDPVFSKYFQEIIEKLKKYRQNEPKHIIVSLVNARRSSKYASIAPYYTKIVDKIIEVFGTDIILISTSPGEGDLTLAHEVQMNSQYQNMIQVQEEQIDLDTLSRAYVNAQLVIGMRYHALILAALFGLPFIAISRSPKITSLCNTLNQSELTGIETVEIDKIEMKLKSYHLPEKSEKAIMEEKVKNLIELSDSHNRKWFNSILIKYGS